MSIRLRVVDGTLVALCAARSVEKPGDVYLDDGQHYALAEKFWRDYPELAINVDAAVEAIVDREESNNPARKDWDQVYGRARETQNEQD